ELADEALLLGDGKRAPLAVRHGRDRERQAHLVVRGAAAHGTTLPPGAYHGAPAPVQLRAMPMTSLGSVEVGASLAARSRVSRPACRTRRSRSTRSTSPTSSSGSARIARAPSPRCAPNGPSRS